MVATYKKTILSDDGLDCRLARASSVTSASSVSSNLTRRPTRGGRRHGISLMTARAHECQTIWVHLGDIRTLHSLLCFSFIKARLVRKQSLSDESMVTSHETLKMIKALHVRRRGKESTSELALGIGDVVACRGGIEVVALVPQSDFPVCVGRIAHSYVIE